MWIRLDLREFGNKKEVSKIYINNISGMRFGKLTAISSTNKRNKNKNIIWKCRCDCGNICYVESFNLLAGHTKTCGDAKHIILDSKPNARNKSGYKGICWIKDRQKWISYINYLGRQYNLLRSDNFDDCFIARKEAENAIANNNFEDWIIKYKS